jgi:hypothetical protein
MSKAFSIRSFKTIFTKFRWKNASEISFGKIKNALEQIRTSIEPRTQQLPLANEYEKLSALTPIRKTKGKCNTIL